MAVLGATPYPPLPTTVEATPLTIKNGPNSTASRIPFSIATLAFSRVKTKTLSLLNPISPPPHPVPPPTEYIFPSFITVPVALIAIDDVL